MDIRIYFIVRYTLISNLKQILDPSVFYNRQSVGKLKHPALDAGNITRLPGKRGPSSLSSLLVM